MSAIAMGVAMTKFLFGKAVAVFQTTVFLAACANQTAPENFEMTDLESTGIEYAADTGPLVVNVSDHSAAPSSRVAIGEFTGLLRGEPLSLGYEPDPQ